MAQCSRILRETQASPAQTGWLTTPAAGMCVCVCVSTWEHVLLCVCTSPNSETKVVRRRDAGKKETAAATWTAVNTLWAGNPAEPMSCYLVVATLQMWQFSALSIIINWISLGFGLSVRQNKQWSDVTPGASDGCFHRVFTLNRPRYD